MRAVPDDRPRARQPGVGLGGARSRRQAERGRESRDVGAIRRPQHPAQAAGAWVNSAVVADSDPDLNSDAVSSAQTINVMEPAVAATPLQVVALQPQEVGSGRTSIALTFNQPLDPASAVDRSHYVIIGPIRDGEIRPCDRRRIRIERIIDEPASLAVIIVPAERLDPGRTFLLSVSGIVDAQGDVLDGAGDGQPWSPFQALFRVPRESRRALRS